MPEEPGNIYGWIQAKKKCEEEGSLEIEGLGSMAGGHCYQSW